MPAQQVSRPAGPARATRPEQGAPAAGAGIGNAGRLERLGIGNADAPRSMPFPHRAEIARLLGRDVDAEAVLDPARCEERGAEAFTEDGVVHFADATPTVEVAAHEAAHVLQHQGHTHDAGLGAEGHAEAVESAVGGHRSAAGLVGGHGARVAGRTHDKKKTSKAKPVELLADIADFDTVTDAAKTSGLTSKADVYIGNYGVNAGQAAKVHGAGAHYAPMFTANAKKCAAFDARAAGEGEDATDIEHRALKGASAFNPVRERFSAAQRKAHTPQELADKIPDSVWKEKEKEAFAEGLEAGRRMRDSIRSNPAMAEGDSWQLDEVYPSMSKPEVYGPKQENVAREWLRGIIWGIAHGRRDKTHHDNLMKGFVHVDHPERLIGVGNAGEMKKFWSTMANCTAHMVGEEYPAIQKGGAEAEADKMAGSIDKLATYGKAGKALAKNYVASYSPGYHTGNLGGNVGHESDTAFEKDRAAYKRARTKAGHVAGLSEWYFVSENVQGTKGKARTKRVLAEDAKIAGTIT